MRLRWASHRSASRAVAFVAAVCALSAVHARAADAPPVAESAPIGAPEPLTPLRAGYPEGARGDASVVLSVTVDPQGNVRAARVIDGREPFATAALRASSAWRFVPATRGAKPVAATVRVQIRFTAPAPAEPPRAPPPTTSVAATPAVPLEVRVQGEAVRREPALTKAEVTLLPGAFGDPFRAIEALPGVTPIVSGLPFFFVRGAPPGDVGYFIDGVRVPLLFHVGLGPSVVHPAIIDHVDLDAGGYSAKLGRFAGGIVSGALRQPETEQHGAAEIRLVDAGVSIGGPFADGRGSVFAAARYSYTGAILSLVSPSVELGYWDYQLRASYRPTPRDEIGIFTFGAHDHLGTKDATVSRTSLDATFHRVDVHYDRRIGGPEDRVRTAVTLGYDETAVEGGIVTDKILATRIELSKSLTSALVLRTGADLALDLYDGHPGPGIGIGSAVPDLDQLLSRLLGSTSTTLPLAPRTDIAIGAYVEGVVRVTPRLTVTPGLRFDVYASRASLATAIDPRLSARLAITDTIRLVQAHGIASQPPSFIIPLPGFQPSLAGGLQRAVQTSIGVEMDLPSETSASVMLYRNAYFNLTDPLGRSVGLATATFVAGNGGAESRTNGSSAGLEMNLRRRLTRRLGGLLSYTLSRSVRGPVQGGIASLYDRAHVINAATTYDFGRGFKGGTRLLFYTGSPFWTAVYDPTGALRGAAATSRLPPFFRFDARFEKRWTLGRRGWISAILEIANAFFAKEPIQGAIGDPPQRLGPVTLPSLAIEAGF